MKSSKQKYNAFFERKVYLIVIIMILTLIFSLLLIFLNHGDIVLFCALVCIITSLTCIVRCGIWKGRLSLCTSDPLWRMLVLKKREHEYQNISLNHAKKCFFASLISLTFEIISIIFYII